MGVFRTLLLFSLLRPRRTFMGGFCIHPPMGLFGRGPRYHRPGHGPGGFGRGPHFGGPYGPGHNGPHHGF